MKKKKPKAPPKPTSYVMVRLPEEVRRRFKSWCVRQGVSMTQNLVDHITRVTKDEQAI